MARPTTASATGGPIEPRSRTDAAAADRPHLVQLYEEDAALHEIVGEFLGEGLERGEGVAVIATEAHRQGFLAALSARGHDVEAARAAGRLVLLDARETLDRLLVGGMPDPERFSRLVSEVFDGFGTRGLAEVRAYGEMVDVLWRGGDAGAALRLEELWNDLQATRPFTLLCAYAMAGFYAQGSGLAPVCAAHTHVYLPAESADDATTPLTPREARSIAAEIAQRKGVELALRTSLRELRRREAELRIKQKRTERLTMITSAIADAVTAEQVFDAVVEHVAVALDASTAALWLVADDRTTVSMVRSRGYPEEVVAMFQGVPLEAPRTFPALDAIRTGQPVTLASQEALIAQYPHLAAVATRGRAYQISCLPIVVHGQPIGSLGFTFEDGRDFDLEEQGVLLLVARYSAQALERLRLLETERRSRAQAESSAARMELLGTATALFAEPVTEMPGLLQAFVDRVTATYADLCAMMLVSERDGRIDVVAVQHRDPVARDEIEAALDAAPLRVGEGITGRVVSSGVSLLVPEVDLAAIQRSTHPSLRALVEKSGARSLLVVPLRARGTSIGILAVARLEGAPAFTFDDQRLVEELAERAAVAIETGRLYRDNQAGRHTAELLYGMAASVIGAGDVEDVFSVALDAIESAVGAPRSSILVFDAEGVMRFRAWRGLSDDYRRAVEGHSPWSPDVRMPEPILVPDVETAPSMAPYLEVFRREGIRAVGFIPLVAGGRLIGKFMVYYAEPHPLSSTEVDMATAIANSVAAAVARFSALDELHQTVRFNEMFTAILGHDLRNPLGAIMAAAELVARRDDDDGKLTKPISRILRSGARMARMIDQLLDFTRVRVGTGIPIAPARLDLVPVLREAMDEIGERNPGTKLRLERGHADTVGVWDGDRLSQVFSNLVANAVKHGAPGAPVTVRIEEVGGALRIGVHNRGAIPEAILPAVFQPMVGIDRARDKSEGLGLGLFISQEILKAHGGRLDVRSSEAEGTLFSVSLPRVAPAAKVRK